MRNLAAQKEQTQTQVPVSSTADSVYDKLRILNGQSGWPRPNPWYPASSGSPFPLQPLSPSTNSGCTILNDDMHSKKGQ